MEILTIPLILFLTVVVPVWIVFHYITIWKRENRQRRMENHKYADLEEIAQTLEDRLDAVERVLDVDAPDWRSRA